VAYKKIQKNPLYLAYNTAYYLVPGKCSIEHTKAGMYFQFSNAMQNLTLIFKFSETFFFDRPDRPESQAYGRNF
jgi:hypothetical protein